MQTKKIIYVLLGVFFFFLLASFFAKPLVIYFAKRQLIKAFKGGVVNIGGCSLVPLGRLSFSDLEIKQAPGLELKIKKAEIKYGFFSLEGYLDIPEFKYDKLRVENIQGEVSKGGDSLFFNKLYGRFLKGDIEGSGRLNLGKDLQYYAQLKISNIDLEKFIQDFELGKDLQLSGRLSGIIELAGNSQQLNMLKGNFGALKPGGVLTIKNKDYLERMAEEMHKPPDLLVENLQNYHYNTGVLSVSLEKNTPVLDIVLDGEAGKRGFTVALHNFNREGK